MSSSQPKSCVTGKQGLAGVPLFSASQSMNGTDPCLPYGQQGGGHRPISSASFCEIGQPLYAQGRAFSHLFHALHSTSQGPGPVALCGLACLKFAALGSGDSGVSSVGETDGKSRSAAPCNQAEPLYMVPAGVTGCHVNRV